MVHQRAGKRHRVILVLRHPAKTRPMLLYTCIHTVHDSLVYCVRRVTRVPETTFLARHCRHKSQLTARCPMCGANRGEFLMLVIVALSQQVTEPRAPSFISHAQSHIPGEKQTNKCRSSACQHHARVHIQEDVLPVMLNDFVRSFECFFV